jgi:hypothetical protein
MKTCTKCGQTKPLDEFHRFQASRDGRRAECKDCSCARRRSQYVPSPLYRRSVAGTCAFCGDPFEYERTSGPPRKYCSTRCKYQGGEQMKVNRAAISTRCCPCGSTDVARVGKPVCPACRKDPRTSESNKARERRRILRLYNISQTDWDAMVARQGNCCAICRTDKPGGRGESWAIDHDHRCCPGKGSCGRCVRALLCTNCNLTIGYAGDDPARLRAMAAYIEAARQPALFVA